MAQRPKPIALLVSSISPSAEEWLLPVLHACRRHRCAVAHAHSSHWGALCLNYFQLSGHWGSVAKMEAILPALAQEHKARILMERTLPSEHPAQHIPYQIQATTPEKSGVLHEMLCFLTQHQVHVEHLEASTYPAPKTQYPMSHVQLTIHVPGSVSIPALRDAFLGFCDDRNVDAYIEPYKVS